MDWMMRHLGVRNPSSYGGRKAHANRIPRGPSQAVVDSRFTDFCATWTADPACIRYYLCTSSFGTGRPAVGTTRSLPISFSHQSLCFFFIYPQCD